MAGSRDQVGVFPAAGPQAREDRLFYKLTDKDGIKMISGEKTPVLLSLWCSNDVVQFGSITVLSGGAKPQQTEYDSHPGDAVFYVTQGKISFHIRDRKETYTVAEGDFMFIPAGEAYKLINFYGGTAKAIFSIAPKL